MQSASLTSLITQHDNNNQLLACNERASLTSLITQHDNNNQLLACNV